ncbi:MAG: hypothetical protein R3281_17105, partial [Balneolaceae bacterium]|nr:hypothetical protein [Balneolaceae bacterium]
NTNPAYQKELVNGGGGEPALRLTESFTQSLILIYSGTIQLSDKVLFKSEASFFSRRSVDYLTEELRSIDIADPPPAEQARLAQIFEENQDGFLKEKPWISGMAGVEFTLRDWTIGTQFIDEIILEYDEQLLQEQHYPYVTLLLQRSFARDKLEFRSFSRFNMEGEDFWLNPEFTYTGIDNLEASLGTQLFGGADPGDYYGHLSFSNYASNSFGYLQVTAYF